MNFCAFGKQKPTGVKMALLGSKNMMSTLTPPKLRAIAALTHVPQLGTGGSSSTR